MPQFDPTFFASQLFWLAISFCFMVIVVKGLLIPKVEAAIMQRQHQIDQLIQQQQKLLLEIENIKSYNDQRIENAKAAVRGQIFDLTHSLKEELQKTTSKLDHVYSAEYHSLLKNKKESLKGLDIEPIVFKTVCQIIKKLEGHDPSSEIKIKMSSFIHQNLSESHDIISEEPS